MSEVAQILLREFSCHAQAIAYAERMARSFAAMHSMKAADYQQAAVEIRAMCADKATSPSFRSIEEAANKDARQIMRGTLNEGGL